MKLEHKSVIQLRKQLDKVFSEYIRKRDIGICFTCGDKKEWKYQQCGHYISRSHQSTRFDEINCHCQCSRCNVFMYGNMPSYTIELQKRYGWDIVKTLKKQGDKLKQWKQKELIELILLYQQKINELDCK